MKNKKIAPAESPEPKQKAQKEKTKIALHTLHGMVMEDIKSIIHCQSDNIYTTFFFENKRKIMVSKPIAEFEKILSDNSFLRVHKSHLINLNAVKEYIKGKGGQVKMTDGSMVDISPKHKAELLDRLNEL